LRGMSARVTSNVPFPSNELTFPCSIPGPTLPCSPKLRSLRAIYEISSARRLSGGRDELGARNSSRHYVHGILPAKKSRPYRPPRSRRRSFAGGGGTVVPGRNQPRLTYAGPAPSRGDSRYPKLLITLHPRRARYRARVSHYHVNIVVRRSRGKRGRLRGYDLPSPSPTLLDILFYGR
jgi:hypothetical protein